jgi:hypothetical protein
MKRIEFTITLMLFVVLQLGVTIGTLANAGSNEQVAEMEQDTSAIADTAKAPHDSTLIDISALWTGHWRAAETEDEKKQRLQAIDEVTEDMGRFKRGKARGRLKKRTTPSPVLMIEIKDSILTIGSEDHKLKFELGGSPIEISGDDGKSQVSAHIEGELLIVVAKTDKGERTTTYRASDAGLSLEVTITGDKLDSPLKYVTTYTRVDEADQ